MSETEQNCGAANTPMSDLVRALAEELEAGWRLRADARDGMATHSCGDELSREVGRILRESIASAIREPQP